MASVEMTNLKRTVGRTRRHLDVARASWESLLRVGLLSRRTSFFTRSARTTQVPVSAGVMAGTSPLSGGR